MRIDGRERRVMLMADTGTAASRRIRILGAISLPHFDGCSLKGAPLCPQGWRLSGDVKVPKQIQLSQGIGRRLSLGTVPKGVIASLGQFRSHKSIMTVLFYSMAGPQVP